MNPIRIVRHLDSTKMELPELEPLLGKTVEIFVHEQSSAPALETRATLFGLRPAQPQQTPEERAKEIAWLRETAKTDHALAAALEISAAGGSDIEAILRLRAQG